MSEHKSLNLIKFSCRRAGKALLALIVLEASVTVFADVDPELLWLPRNYNHHYKTLYRAANTVEQHERCVKVIAASLSESESDIEHPVFKITCRDNQRVSFIAIVDGFTNEILNLPPPAVEVEPEPEPELTAAEIVERARQAKLDKYWQRCFSQIEKRSRELKFLEWLHEERPEPVEETKSSLVFQVDFNARTDSGETLEFRGQCDFQGDEKTIEVHARNLVPREFPKEEGNENRDLEWPLESETVEYIKGAKPVLIPERIESKVDPALDPEIDTEAVFEGAQESVEDDSL